MAEKKGESALKSPVLLNTNSTKSKVKVEVPSFEGDSSKVKAPHPLKVKLEQGDLGKVKAPHPLKVKLEQDTNLDVKVEVPSFKGDLGKVTAPHLLKVKLEQDTNLDVKVEVPYFKGDLGKVKAPHPLKVKLEQDTNLNVKVEVPSFKGDSGKAKAPHPLELSLEQDLPENTTCLMDCEAVDILKRFQEGMGAFSIEPPVSFGRGLEYAQSNRLYDNPQAIKQILEPLKQHGVSDGEVCMIANFHLESVDEVLALVPSLKTKMSKLIVPLENVLAELAKLRRAA